MTSQKLVPKLQKQLFSIKDANVFVVLDGASVPSLLEKLDLCKPEYYCLYRGELAPDLAETAPYLVRIERDSEFIKWVCSGFGQHWGVFAIAKANLRIMRQHFRHFLMVQTPNGKSVYFRFYDPRVLRVYLPTCNTKERKILFGSSVLSYLVEDEKTESFLRFSP